MKVDKRQASEGKSGMYQGEGERERDHKNQDAVAI
jgi:hypothetical protein